MMKRKTKSLIILTIICCLSCGKNLTFTSSLVTGFSEMTGIQVKEMDYEWHLIEIYRLSEKSEFSIFSTGEEKARFDELSRSYGDTCYNREIDLEYMSVGTAVQRTARIDVVSDCDFDATHPVGSSLNDLIIFYGATPYPCIASGYKEFFNGFDTLPHPTDNPVYNCSQNYYVHSPNEPKPFFPIVKRLCDMREEDFLLTCGNASITAGVLFFTSKPEGEQTHTLTVTLTTTEGEQFSDEVVYTF